MNDYTFVLADGIGGNNAGEIASRLAVENFLRIIEDNDKLIRNDKEKKSQIQKLIIDAIYKTNKIIFEKSNQELKYYGMGTTIVIALFQYPNILHIANVGDSRAYLYREGKLKLLSKDHSVVGSLIREGAITKSEAADHPYRHHITQSIGTSNEIKPFTKIINISPKDIILLCSDGLWDALSDDQIINSIQKNKSLEKICENLNSKANKMRSQDNISSIVIKFSKQ